MTITDPFRAETYGHMSRARACIARGDARGAIEALRWALSLDPMSAPAHAMLSACLIDTKRVHAAEHEAREALSIDPELPDGLLALAHVRFAQNRFKEVESLVDEILRREPDAVEAWRLRARVLLARGRPREAIAVLERACSIDPEDLSTRVALGHALLADDQVERADELSLGVLKEHAENREALLLRGWVLLHRGKVKDAREHALMALRQNASSRDDLTLLVAVKTRSNILLGLWWRYNARLGAVSSSARVLALLAMFAFYRVATIAVTQLGWPGVASVVQFVWLAFALYTWVGPMTFHRMLRKEFDTVRLRRGF